MKRYKQNREFLKANFQVLDGIKTDRQKGLLVPHYQKEYDHEMNLITLPEVKKEMLTKPNVFDCLEDRRSIRKYSLESISIGQLSYLLWATQGIQKVTNNNTSTLRRVPSGGAAHPFVANFVSKSAVIFAWSCIPYRAEYKFDITAHKKILIDVGHLCQNLYIAAESIDCGTCAIGIYDQKLIDEMLNLDGEDEFVVYMAALGKKMND